MLYNIIKFFLKEALMARGKSGRIVIEIDPQLKRQLYSTLENNQKTMKEWFVKEAEVFVYGEKKPSSLEVDDRHINLKNEPDSDE